MANTEFSLRDINDNILAQHPAIVRLPKITAPYTTITNRAQVTNFAADGLPRMGVDRVAIQSSIEVQGEAGPNGERVFKALNDVHDAARFVGGWINVQTADGQFTTATVINSYVEITFYGTALNLLCISSTSRDWRVSIDGGAEGSDIAPDEATTTVSRGYNPNLIVNVASGLSLGIHTAKIRLASGSNLNISGYEILNTSASIFLPSAQTYVGGRRLYSASTSTTAYNSGFESGTLGTRGGHVLVYQKADGTIAKAVTPTNASAAYLSSADHTNEEVQRVYHWREFGAGRADDFSIAVGGPFNKAFTLDDGTTTLVGSQIDVAVSIGDLLRLGTGSGFITLTFVGTGLDWVCREDTTGTRDTLALTVDGASQGNLPAGAVASERIEKLCSGLPYGTHTVKILLSGVGTVRTSVKQFIVYAPKTPTLPAGAVALADYFVMADFAPNSTQTSEAIARGVLRKSHMREMVYTGTYGTPTIDALSTSGFFITNNTNLNVIRYVFFGTGFDCRFNGSATNGTYGTFSIDGSSTLNATNSSPVGGAGWTGSLTTSNTTGGYSVTLSSGAVVNAGAGGYGCGVSIRGLTLGLHTVTFTHSSLAANLYLEAFDIITPIHAPKEVGPARLQNTSLIGSCGIRDLRNFGEQQVKEQKAVGQAVGVTSNPTSNSTSSIPFPDMSTVIKTSGNPILVNYSVQVRCDTVGAGMTMAIRVNGVAVAAKTLNAPVANYVTVIADSFVVPVAAGTHKIDVYWSTSAGTMLAFSTDRNLYAREL
jgi:hypothetical protein